MIVWRCTEMFEPHEDPVPWGCDSLSLCREISTLESNTFPLKVGIWLPIDTASYTRRRLSTATPLQKKVHIYVKVWRLVHLVDCKFRSRNFHRISVTGKIAIWLYLVLKIFFFPVPQTKCSLLPEKYRGYIPGYRRVGYSIWPLISIECQACRFDNTSKWVNEGNF